MYGLFTLYNLNERKVKADFRSEASCIFPDYGYFIDIHGREYWEHRSADRVVVVTRPKGYSANFEVLLFTGDISGHATATGHDIFTGWQDINVATKVWRTITREETLILAELLTDSTIDPEYLTFSKLQALYHSGLNPHNFYGRDPAVLFGKRFTYYQDINGRHYWEQETHGLTIKIDHLDNRGLPFDLQVTGNKNGFLLGFHSGTVSGLLWTIVDNYGYWIRRSKQEAID